MHCVDICTHSIKAVIGIQVAAQNDINSHIFKNHHTLSGEKKPVLLKNVLGNAVKRISFIKSQLLSIHPFNIL